MSNVFAPFAAATEPFYSVRLSYLTDVITAEDGTEQRVMLRIIPVREHSFLARAYQAYRSGWLDSLTYGNQNSQLATPEWPHGTFLTSAVTAGSARVFNVITTADTDFAVDGYAVLWNDEGHTEEVTITAKTATSITATTAYNWAQGTFVIPSHKGNYSGQLPISRQAGFFADLPVTMTMEHGTDPEVSTPEEAEVFDAVPYMRVDVSHTLTRQVERVESPTYTFADYQLGDAPIGRRPFKVWLASRASVTALVSWFHSVRGRCRTFYLPTYQQDLEVVSGLGTTTVVVKRCGYTANLFPMVTRQIIAAVQPNGTVTPCTVLSATDNGVAANTETLTFDTAPAATAMLSYMLYGRLESDTLEIQWRTNGFADCEMGFIECPSELAPTELEAFPDDDNAGTPNVVAGPVDAAFSTAVVPNGQDEVPTYATVTARDANGIRRTEGGDVVAASITGANTASATVTDLDNGQYRLVMTPHNTGTDLWAITLGGVAIRNSPYTSIVGTTPVVIPVAMPFGFWASESFEASLDYVANITSVHKGITPGQQDELLDIVASHGAKMVFAHPKALLKDSAGRFSLSRFMTATDNLAASAGFAAHVAAGDAAMHQIADDIGAERWGGQAIPKSTLSAACAYSKSVWPTIPTMIRQVPTGLLSMTDMDYACCLYRHDRGDVTAYRAANESAANQIGCDLMMGLHIVNGGDGSSGVVGTGEKPGWYAMSATEILRYGRVLMASSKAKWFNSFRFHDNTPHLVTYFNRSDIRAAVTTLALDASQEVR